MSIAQKTRNTDSNRKWDSKILIVDDDASIFVLLEEQIKGMLPNARVDWAQSGEEAQTRIKLTQGKPSEEYKLALVDINLPGSIKGFDVWQQLEDRCPQTKIAMISSYTSDQFYNMVTKAKKYPDYMQKPILRHDLMRLVYKTA